MKLKLLILLMFLFFNSHSQNHVWVKNLYHANTQQVATDSSGNLYLVGSFIDTVDFDPGPNIYNLISAGNQDIFILKLDSTGNFLWAHSFGGALLDYARSLVVDPSGNCYIVGEFTGSVDFDPGPQILTKTSNGSLDCFITKYNSDGDFLWVNTFGGIDLDRVQVIKLTKNFESLVITGMFEGTVDLEPGTGVDYFTSQATDVYIMKRDTSGSFNWWVMQISGISNESVHSLTLDNDDNVILGGTFNFTVDFDPGPGVYNLTAIAHNFTYILKLNSAGNFKWAGRTGGFPASQSFVTDQLNNIYVTGAFHTSSADFDPGPGIHMLHPLGSNSDGFITKIDSSGNLIWGHSFGNTGIDVGRSIKLDTAGSLYVIGTFEGNVDFNPDSNSYILSSNGYSDIFILKLDSSSNFLWAISYGGSAGEHISSLEIDEKMNLFITGHIYSNVDFDPGPLLDTINLVSTSYAFIQKMNQCISPTLSTTINQPLCFNDTGSASTLVSGGVAPYLYTWSNGDDSSYVSGLTSGVYSFYVLDQMMCKAFDTLVIVEPPQIISVISSMPTNFNSPNCNGSVSINPTGGTPPYNISWSSGTTTNLCEGWYTATITDANGCVETDSVYINFITGIEELTVKGITIYPNPARDILTVNSENKEIGELKIYDVVGKLIYSELINNNNAEIDVKEFDAGIYFVEIDGLAAKFVKE